MKLKKEWWLVLSLFGLFFFSRLINLNLLPVFADEAIYIRWAQIMWHDASNRFIPLSDGKPPLFMWLMIPFLKVIFDPLIAGRLLSVASGFLTLVGSFLLAKKLFNAKTAFLASILIIVSPFLLFYDRVALVDSLLTALAVWSFYLAYLLLDNPKNDLGILLGTAWGLAMLTKPTGAYFPLLTPFLLLAFPLKNWLTKIKKLIIPSVLASIYALSIYNILRLSPAIHMIKGRSADYLRSKQEILANPFQFIPGTARVMTDWLINWLTWPLFLSLLVSLFLALKRKQIKIAILFCWSLVPFFIQAAIGKIIYPRYLLLIAPFLLIIISWGLSQRFRIKKFEIPVFLIIGLLLIKPLVYDFFLLTKIEKAPLHRAEREQYLEEWSAGFGIRETAEFLKSQPKNQKIIIGTEGYFGTLPDGLSIYVDGIENIEVRGLGQPLARFPNQLDNVSKTNPTYILVNNTRINFQSDRLELIQSYPKPAGPKRQESLLFFKVKPQ
ncbi:MAG TPA: glycosyltransferase family 39 protein [Candidatus Bathyarchaeia archaeon]|nr:glycosyltransferase family 39 protein [Candidatus Bathyarchaeia archaeon]